MREGLALTVQPDGGCRITGTRNGKNAQWFSAKVGAGDSGLVAGRTYSLTLGGADASRTVAGVYGYDEGGATVLNTSTTLASKTFTMPAEVKTLLMRIQCTTEGAGEQADETVYPMLVEGMPAEYVPYALGGGQVLDNLWRWTDVVPAQFKLLDDGGLSVDYDGVDPVSKWNNTMWRGTLADADMRVGETYYLAEFGGGSASNVNVRFLDADMRIITEQPSAFEKAFAVPDGAAYVEMYVSLNGKQEPQRFTSYPMLVRGSARPAGFVPPNKAGGVSPNYGLRATPM